MQNHFARIGVALVLALSLPLAGCCDQCDQDGTGGGPTMIMTTKTTTTTTITDIPGPSAGARILAVAGSGVVGEATFTTLGEQVTLTVMVENALEGEHGIHIHEIGDCGQDGTAAGEHWNPTGALHGRFGSGDFHLGDIGNITVGPDGRGELELTTDLWTVADGSGTDVLNHAIILHEHQDDYVTQPSGNSGGPIACGVIAAK